MLSKFIWEEKEKGKSCITKSEDIIRWERHEYKLILPERLVFCENNYFYWMVHCSSVLC
jgi:hypothetical protein